MSRRQPRSISFAAEALADRLAPKTLLADVQRAWPRVAGERLAAEAAPAAERDGVVTLDCRSAVWAHELDLLGPALVEALNEALGRPAVSRLRTRAIPPR